MGSMTTESESSRLVGAEPDAGTPPESVLITCHVLDAHLASQSGDALKLLADPGCLEPTLRCEGNVLIVATAAPTRTGVGTRGRYPIGRGTQNFGGIGADERGCRGRNLCRDLLPGQRVTHEDHASIGCVSDTAAAVNDLAHFEFEEFARAGSLTPDPASAIATLTPDPASAIATLTPDPASPIAGPVDASHEANTM
jgi:hypothetical protein